MSIRHRCGSCHRRRSGSGQIARGGGGGRGLLETGGRWDSLRKRWFARRRRRRMCRGCRPREHWSLWWALWLGLWLGLSQYRARYCCGMCRVHGTRRDRVRGRSGHWGTARTDRMLTAALAEIGGRCRRAQHCSWYVATRARDATRQVGMTFDGCSMFDQKLENERVFLFEKSHLLCFQAFRLKEIRTPYNTNVGFRHEISLRMSNHFLQKLQQVIQQLERIRWQFTQQGGILLNLYFGSRALFKSVDKGVVQTVRYDGFGHV
mmetsp:Transcript_219/g.655  ORF Transcript_219/g.655 Transcript_219/m.655 type:complete len:263 (-) Transcript_219:759-1547(-)